MARLPYSWAYKYHAVPIIEKCAFFAGKTDGVPYNESKNTAARSQAWPSHHAKISVAAAPFIATPCKIMPMGLIMIE